MNKIPVAILAATGSVGQRFVQLLDNHPAASALQDTIRKPQAPLKGGIFGAAGVSIRRTREDPRF